MGTTILQVVLTIGAVWSIAALSAKLARKSAELEQAKREDAEREKVENMVDSVADLPADNVRQRLQNLGHKD